MIRQILGYVGVAFAAIAFAAALAPAGASTTSPAQVKWNTQVVVTMSLTPNYALGFGQVKAVFGTQPAPTHGPNAGPGTGQGDVDFGNVLSGTDYIYKYAAHLNVTTNDPSGFQVYGEGAADFYNQTDASTTPISSTIFYASSTSGSPADTNNGFTPGLPFEKTSGTVTGGSYGVAPTINYGGSYPSTPVATHVSATGDFYWDYLLKVPSTATGGKYFVWIVYTVVPS